ncbi:MAG: hypothetical protein FWD81_01515, partial [Methanomassiliicoccaceae archaeon]|nr:hypothetical protein [Methanomassiliicoccaceae archaeon]
MQNDEIQEVCNGGVRGLGSFGRFAGGLSAERRRNGGGESYPLSNPGYIPVTGITGLPNTAQVGIPLNLTGTVDPFGATLDNITWRIVNQGTTGATISGNQFNATSDGTATVSATIHYDQFVTIASGLSHSLGIRVDGTLWAWGLNTSGQLGDGTNVNKTAPVQIGTDTDWATVAAGSQHSLATKTDGTLWAWGNNGEGQLGFAPYITLNPTPVKVGADTNWASAVTGEFHSFAIKTDGALWGWGRNTVGQLGLGYTSTFFVGLPTQVGTDTNWASLSGGNGHTIALKTNGTLWGWGGNASGQVGQGATGGTYHSPTQIGTDNNWAWISTGGATTFAIKTNGTLWACGSSQFGRIGNGDIANNTYPSLLQVGTDTNWATVAGGLYHGVATKTDGTVWGWGANLTRSIGDGTTTQRPTPVPATTVGTGFVAVFAGTDFSLGLMADGSLKGWGRNDSGQTGTGLAPNINSPGYVFEAPVPMWESIAAGSEYTLAIKTNGTLWAWGQNTYGKLGDGTTTQRNSPVQIGTDADWKSVDAGIDHTIAIKTDGTLWAWGRNNNGQIGQGGTGGNYYSPTQVGTDTNWASISAGDNHALAMKTNGTLWAWGQNNSGQLGDNTPIDKNSPVQVGTDTNWASVSAGGRHSLGIKTDGTLWAWGTNGEGQIGDTTTTQRNLPVPIGSATDWASVSAGGRHSLGIKTDGTLWAWGQNNTNQLGDNTNLNRNVPTRIGSATDWASVSAGDNHSMGIRTNGDLWGWGVNGDGRVNGGLQNRPAPVLVGTGFESVSAGGNHTATIKIDGSAWTWGRNLNGQLGDGTTTNKFTTRVSYVPHFTTTFNINVTSGNNVTLNFAGTGQVDVTVGTAAPQTLSGPGPHVITVPTNETITLTADPTNFVGWSGHKPSNSLEISFTPIDDVSVTATFDSNGNRTLDLTIAGTGVVSVNGITYDDSDILYFPVGVQVLLAIPVTTNFVGWSGAVTHNSAFASIITDVNKSVTATFDSLGN